LTTVNAQDRNDLRGYDREQKAIIIYDDGRGSPVDTVLVRDVLEVNRNTPVSNQYITNEEIFELMEEEELMREQREIPE